ncbi:SDR family NAD(P)-dependent oxidoreductase [Pontibacter korlensis]|uniref:Daunorubicin C-13 ketoreductase n=1 Tax=Pontibacter korlensis TaxID=400092 RepID=A0A0E3UXH2_9BACT|nr:SDR family NAD(P)-dependent oxidoreductase [Pontibacter korlensis]AKD04262.1 daunorubicin C-13 ketoreductase [Pontibacter korlensis]
MARIFITGSADGLGQLAAKELLVQGHRVVLHARNAARGRDAINQNPGAEAVVTGDLSGMEETKHLASEVNGLGAFDAVVHNAGVYQAPAKRILAVNTLAPYILTCLIQKPKRLIYLSSDMHLNGQLKLENFTGDRSRITYSDSKLHLQALCMAVARKWPEVYANAVDPGWVPTKMGGSGAPGDLQKGYETQVWLAASNDEKANVSGRYFFHQKEGHHSPDADDVGLQERLLNMCKELTGVSFPQ